MTFSFNHDFNLGFSMLCFVIAISKEWEGKLTWNERDLSRYDIGSII